MYQLCKSMLMDWLDIPTRFLTEVIILATLNVRFVTKCLMATTGLHGYLTGKGSYKMPETRMSHAHSKFSLAERLQQAVENRRGMQKAVPIDLGRYLNESQLLALRSLENFGWHLWFVRRPLFMQPIVIVSNAEATQHAQLEDDGSVNLKPALQFRH